VEGVEGVLYQVAETLPEAVLAKMHAAPKDESVPVVDPATINEAVRAHLGKQGLGRRDVVGGRGVRLQLLFPSSSPHVHPPTTQDGFVFGFPTRFGTMPAQFKVCRRGKSCFLMGAINFGRLAATFVVCA
jgi:hypothetical protein